MASHGEQVTKPPVSHDGIDDWLEKVDMLLDELDEPDEPAGGDEAAVEGGG
jgi:hypothetical protein